MTNLQGSWVAIPTPFTEDNKIDFKALDTGREKADRT